MSSAPVWVLQVFNATPFQPQFTSYLPQDTTASAQLGDPARQLYSDGAAAAPLLPAQDVAAPATSSNSADLKAMLAKMLMQHERQRSDALDGGYFSGTNAQRQAILRANRRYPSGGSGESASGGSKASGSAGGASGGLY